MPKIGDHEYVIELPGVPQESQPLVEEETNRLVSLAAAMAEKRKAPFLLKLVRLTSTFQDDVNMLSGQNKGLKSYSATRESVHAIGKTLCIQSQEDSFGFAVVVDTTPFGTFGKNNPWHITTLLHELIHVIFEGQHLQSLGEGLYLAETDTAEGLLSRWARRLLDEYDVNREVDSIVKALYKKENGESFSLPEFEAIKGIDWVSGLLSALNKMPPVIDDTVVKFQTKEIDIDELCATMLPYLKDLLTLIIHTASILLETESWPANFEQIKQTEAYKRFFKGHLDTMLDQFNDDSTPFVDSETDVKVSVEKIIGNCGLTLETTSQGVYIGVKSPSPHL